MSSRNFWCVYCDSSSASPIDKHTSQQTVQVDSSSLLALTQESLEHTWSIKNLEASVSVLYKALLAGRDRGTHRICLSPGCSHIVRRHGCHYGAFGRVQEVQRAVLQACVRLLVYRLHGTGAFAENLTPSSWAQYAFRSGQDASR